MAHIVIIGASTGGLPAAYECRAALDKTHHISVVSNTPIFQFVPVSYTHLTLPTTPYV